MPGFYIQTTDNCGRQAAFNPFAVASNVETARNHRFSFEVVGVDRTMLAYVSKMTRPKPETDTVIFHQGRDELTRAGRTRWKPITFSVYELLDSNGGTLLTLKMLRQWYGGGTSTAQGQNVAVQNFKESKSDTAKGSYKRTAIIRMTSGTGGQIWKYTLLGSWPTQIDPSDLDYSNTEIAQTTVTLAYDKAIEDNEFAQGDDGSGRRGA